MENSTKATTCRHLLLTLSTYRWQGKSKTQDGRPQIGASKRFATATATSERRKSISTKWTIRVEVQFTSSQLTIKSENLAQRSQSRA